eukprot:scaffold13657_cov139-Skeletonema_marinoi.AAC.1
MNMWKGMTVAAHCTCVSMGQVLRQRVIPCHICKVPGQRQDEDIIQVMASLGFQMNLLARMSANHARDCSFTKSKDLIVFSVDRTKIGELVRCILMPLYNDLLAVLFTYGFFPEVSSFEVCQHSSEFLQLVDGSLSIGQLHAHVIRYMSLMLDNMGLSSSMKNVNDFTDIVMDGNERVFTLPTFVVLSRVRTRKGLFLTKPLLDLERDFNVPESLIDFENRIRTNLEQPTLDTLTQKGYYRPGPEGTHNTE